MAYTLTYFNGRGLAEPIRFLFKYGGIDFEDVRVEQEDWPQLKEKITFGQLPFLKHDGKGINQSVAITRYVGQLVKLGGSNEWENLEIDAIVDTINDLRLKGSAWFYAEGEDKKKAIKDKNREEHFPYYLQRLDAVAGKNNGFLALGRLTWADVFFVALVDLFAIHIDSPNILDKYPNLQKLKATVTNIPSIKKWIEERPKSDW